MGKVLLNFSLSGSSQGQFIGITPIVNGGSLIASSVIIAALVSSQVDNNTMGIVDVESSFVSFTNSIITLNMTMSSDYCSGLLTFAELSTL